MHWEAMRDQGCLVPIDRFFVRNHTSTPLIDAATWRLKLFGGGLRGRPTADAPIELSYEQLRRLPATTLTAFVACAGNGRSFFGSPQAGRYPVRRGSSGRSAWRGGAASASPRYCGSPASPMARSMSCRRASTPTGSGGVDLGPVRRPLSIRKALHDVLLAYEMNGEPLPPDHGHPFRLVVPGWAGISSVKMGRPDRSGGHCPLLAVEYPVLSAVRAGLPPPTEP
jgi:DMSO/TMAO reductase YedYZ molybdopterin-dependent catalytic subunit